MNLKDTLSYAIDKLLDMGIILEDKNDITTWKKKND